MDRRSKGKAVAISEVSDPTFGQEILGKGMAVIPTVGKVVAPVDGRIEMIFDTKHAISYEDSREEQNFDSYRA